MTTSPTPGSDPAARINQLVLDIWLATERNGPRYDEFDLTGQQHAALGLVVAHPGITPTRLADELGVTKGAVSHHLAALEKGGYLTRRRSEDDGRVQVLDLARRGIEYRDAMRRFENYSIERLHARLDDAQLERVVEALTLLRSAYRE